MRRQWECVGGIDVLSVREWFWNGTAGEGAHSERRESRITETAPYRDTEMEESEDVWEDEYAGLAEKVLRRDGCCVVPRSFSIGGGWTQVRRL